MLSLAPDWFRTWKHSWAEYMLEQAVDCAVWQFPLSFPDNATARIYFFVIMNKKVLFQDDFQVLFTGKNFQERRDSCRQVFYNKKFSWKNQISGLSFLLGSEVVLLIQGIANMVNIPQDPWYIPSAYSKKDWFGLTYWGGSGSDGGGTMLPNDSTRIRKMIQEKLSSYGIGGDQISRITAQM
jgi:hypothetical protein